MANMLKRFFGIGARESLAQARKVSHDAWWANYTIKCREAGMKDLAQKIVDIHKADGV